MNAFDGARQQLRPRHDLKFWLARFVIARLDVVGPRYPPIGGIAGAWLAADIAGEGFSPHGFRSLRSPTAKVFSIPQRFASASSGAGSTRKSESPAVLIVGEILMEGYHSIGNCDLGFADRWR